MTTRTTTIEASKPSVRALIGTTLATLSLVGGALLWQARDGGEATPADTPSSSAASEGVAPRGGLAEHHREMPRAVAADAAPTVDVPTPADGVGGDITTAGAATAQATAMGGMAELYRDHATNTRPAGHTGDPSRCGTGVEQTTC